MTENTLVATIVTRWKPDDPNAASVVVEIDLAQQHFIDETGHPLMHECINSTGACSMWCCAGNAFSDMPHLSIPIYPSTKPILSEGSGLCGIPNDFLERLKRKLDGYAQEGTEFPSQLVYPIDI